ncbi:MMPL family transporter [Mycobacterium sp.]|jgi:RND superfamily putative drug exporter|uniref:MMPL/RND family transporter n=1 Tax=Mycobacterium sp. TaxID=1785 RepID=UPI002D2348E5|nr:MMPL family transporter [Mycobacterium sp.]HZA12293.1 MMPL family transporter [Mycobacterium sp.]
MSTRHTLPANTEKRPFIARTIRLLCVPIILGWLAVTIVVNVVAPQLEEVGAEHSVAMTAKDAPSTIAMMRIGKNFQQFDSDTTAMVLLEGQDKLGDDAHRFYDTLIDKLSQDTTHIEHINNFWGDPLTAAGSQSSDGKAAYVQLNLRGDQGGTEANESVAAVQRIVDSVPPPSGIKAYVTGPGPLATDRRVYGDEGAKKITFVTLAVIAVMLLLVYRSIFSTVIMLFTIGIELGAARGVIAVLGNNNLMGLSTFAVNLLIVLAIAASTDYVIFWVGRYQEGRSRGLDRKAAYYNMFSGTAHVILGSGLTVAGAMYCMSFTRLPYFHSLGAPCSLGLLVVLAASLTLGPAIVVVASRFGVFDPKRAHRERGWRRIGTVVVRWPGAVLVATTAVALVGLLALPAYTTNYNDRYYIPAYTPANVGYHASDRHFPQARMEPELLMVEADHDLRNPADMLVLDRIARGVFHIPGMARVQNITRPLGTPIDHSSIPFQISMQSSQTIENLKYLHDAVTNLNKVSDELLVTIKISQHIADLTHQLTGVTHDLASQTHQIQSDTEDLRDHVADFDDFWRPIRNYFYWEPHCFDIPICWSLRSVFDTLDGIDTLTDDIGNVTKDIDKVDVLLPQLDALLPQLITTLQTVRGLTMTTASTFSGLINQMDAFSQNATVMGQAFDDAKNDDSFYLPPEAFQNPDFIRGLKLFLSPDGKSAQYIITHKGDPATPAGISHIDRIMQAAAEAVKGTPLENANLYLGGTAATYKDMHDGSMYDLMIAVTASICLIFMVMLGITRSLVAAAVIVGTVTVSLASSFGLSVLVWQHLLHMPLNWLVLPMAIVIMLAVGSDYNLLLVSRFQEEIHAGLKTGIIRAMGGTGGVVTAAGMVFAFTMGSMIASDLRIAGQIGTTIMLGLLFDTFVVRSFMTPSIAALLGRWFWWPRRVHTHAAPAAGPAAEDSTTTQPLSVGPMNPQGRQ